MNLSHEPSNDTRAPEADVHIDKVDRLCKDAILDIVKNRRRLLDQVTNPDFIQTKKILIETIGRTATEEWLDAVFHQETPHIFSLQPE